MKFVPHEYQSHAIEQVLQQPMIALFLDCGLGKTVIALTAVDKLLRTGGAKHVLVIAPLRVAQETWRTEKSKWDHLRHLQIVAVLGTEQERRFALNRDANIWVINRENIVWLAQLYGNRWPFDTVIVDELSSFKSAKSNRFRALRSVLPYIRRLVGLTGTPATNGLIDLWSQVYLLDKGDRLGKSVSRYRVRYFRHVRGDEQSTARWMPKPETEREIYGRIRDICLSMSAEDWLHMPARVDRVVPIRLPPAALQQYLQLERDLLLPFAGGDVVAGTAAALSTKLLQMANGAVYDERKGVRDLHQAKIDALEDIVEAANGKPVLVFYAYRHDAERIRSRFKFARSLEGSEDIDAWNKGRIALLLAHPASAGHGLNLQDGGHIIVWFGLTWSLELYQQANARLHRQGQKRAVIVHHLIATDTVDEDVMRALAGKAAGQNALLSAVKARIRKVAGRGSI